METLAYIGSILLAICGLPELIRTIRTKKCHIGWGMMLSWFFGEVFVLIYIAQRAEPALLLNYSFNTVIIAIMLFYKIRE
jgi:uncharacterized protein with PQ loop repeat